MKFMPWLVLLYAFILLGGGMMGFYTSHSWPSLIAGSLSAIVLIVSAISLFNNGLLGYFLAVGLSFIFSIFFTNRFIDTFKIMAIISMIVFILLVAAKLKS
jgi:uncharacterized membrane protein (UPF0136 family)